MAAWFWSRRREIRDVVRPIYIEMGIIQAPPELVEEQAGNWVQTNGRVISPVPK